MPARRTHPYDDWVDLYDQVYSYLAHDISFYIQQSMASYRLQGGAYALALQKSSGKSVKEAVFLFLQPETEVVIVDLEGAINAAARAAVASV